MLAVSTNVDPWLLGWAEAAIAGAQFGIRALLNSFGDGTEPSFAAITSIYDRMLAIGLLLTGFFIVCGLAERILGGPLGLGWNAIPRTLVAIGMAFAGLGLVQYLTRVAALLATTWSPGMLGINQQIASLGDAYLHPLWRISLTGDDVVWLIVTATLAAVIAVLVELELVVRAALILTLSAFIPLVAAMSIWPRLAGSATHLAEFLIGLLLSKFVIATAIYVGFGMVVSGIRVPGGAPDYNWLLTGLAILCIAAFSPVVLVQGLRFTHATSGSLVRGWSGSAVAFVSAAPILPGVGALAGGAGRGLAAGTSRLLGGIRRARRGKS